MREVVLPNGRIRRYRTEAEIAEILTRFRSSHVSAGKFAAENGLNLNVLRRWLKVDGAEAEGGPPAGSPRVDFQEVPLSGLSGAGWGAELIVPSGWVLRFAGSASREFMAAVCQAVLR